MPHMRSMMARWLWRLRCRQARPHEHQRDVTSRQELLGGRVVRGGSVPRGVGSGGLPTTERRSGTASSRSSRPSPSSTATAIAACWRSVSASAPTTSASRWPGAELSGIDVTERAVEHVRRRLELRGLTSDLRTGSADRLAFPDDSFDLVYSWGVLHHIAGDTGAAIHEVSPRAQARRSGEGDDLSPAVVRWLHAVAAIRACEGPTADVAGLRCTRGTSRARARGRTRSTRLGSVPRLRDRPDADPARPR